MDDKPDGYLTRAEFRAWHGEHQKYLESQFGKLCAAINEIKSTRVADWAIHKISHKEAEEESEKECKECRISCQKNIDDKILRGRKWLKYLTYSVILLAAITAITHPHAIAFVIGKLIGMETTAIP